MNDLLFFAIVILILGTFWHLWQNPRRNTVTDVLDKLPGPPSQSWWKGNVEQWFTRHSEAFQREVALNYGHVVKLHGLFGNRMLYLSDPKALHHILIKEEPTFEETRSIIAMNNLMFGPGLLSTLGDHHRKQRKMLNPVFSVNHMRHMLPIFYHVIYKLRDAMSAQVLNGHNEIDVLSWTGRAALELIGQGGIGYSFDPLVEDVKNDYGDALKALFPSAMVIDMFRRLAPYVYKLGPTWLRRLVVDMYPNTDIQKFKSIVDTMGKKSAQIYEMKKSALRNGDEAAVRQVGEGKDIMSILMRANGAASEKERLPENEVVAQMTTLIFAAMDTTSNTLSRILQLLATHKDAQDELRKEILDADAHKGLSYEELNRLPFLDAVCRETLRFSPPVTMLLRAPTKDMVVPLQEHVRGLDGKLIRHLPIPKGTEVIVGIQGSNLSKTLWGEDALEWKPRRWLSPLPDTVTDASIPGAYSNLMTFSGGKRACIGFKFSEMEMKVVLCVLLSAFTFDITDKPIEWNVAGVWYPTVGRESNHPQLPLKAALYENTQL